MPYKHCQSRSHKFTKPKYKVNNWPEYNDALRRRGADTVSKAVLLKQSDALIVVPPPKTAVCSSAGDSQRDDHIREIKAHGRIAWQRKTGYGLRAHAELAMQRYKRIIGSAMKARQLPQQKTEAWVSASALNIMSNLGMPVSVKI